ncbi:hypothetical protein CSKR_104098 [Clonorchis sinensis]|uniref:Uncharacterized protein n=1 Tax=Clonorchis sinensis TaxID=79923 RepID=A0A419QB68_CLOSI|nr:hypothetical protein CSKR_104098 [Clonorchis sinensis]
MENGSEKRLTSIVYESFYFLETRGLIIRISLLVVLHRLKQETMHQLEHANRSTVSKLTYEHLSKVFTDHWLRRQLTDLKLHDSNPTSASRLFLSRLGQLGSTPALRPPSFGMAAYCNTLSVPSCLAVQRKHEGWDSARLPKPRQKSRCRGFEPWAFRHQCQAQPNLPAMAFLRLCQAIA